MRTNRWNALAGLISKYQIPVWPMTGTPLPKGLCDAYAQLMLVAPERLPQRRSGRAVLFTGFRDMLHTQPYPNVWKPKPGALEQVYAMMQPAVRFTRAQVMAELDEPIRLRREVPLSSDQKRMLAELQAGGKSQHGDATVKGADAQALATKIVQVACGAVYAQEGKIAYPAATARMEAVKQILTEANSPIILAVPFIHVTHMLREIAEKDKLRVGVIVGETNPNERTNIVHQFQNGELDILICHPKTAAHGLTLTRSHTIVWYAPLYDLELYAQFNDRISRFGQKEKPCIVELFSTPLEAKIYNCVRNKEVLQGKFLSFFEGDVGG
jgi:SNF2 family DNA or RNA helicase